jgi:hypothetical protein
MPEHELIPHPDSQRSYAALRAEFRASALAALRDQYAGHHPVGWLMIGDSAHARDRYDAESWSFEMLHRLDEPVTQDFGLDSVPAAVSVKLEEQAQAAALHESVTWDDSVSGVCDHDAPPCQDVHTMTDVQLCDYIDAAIKESENG